MYIFKQVDELRQHLQQYRADTQTIAFVPTMGALHKGHLSLIHKAQEMADITVASIFVNPTQFDDKEDLVKYPRKDEADIMMLIENNTDVLFLPTVEAVYPEGMEIKTHYDFGMIAQTMEGEHRDGHFAGVAQVVNRLLEIVAPNWIVMGQKDFQQTAIIRQLLKLTQSSTELVISPTIREKDGLAMSSRNVRLNKAERKEAPIIYDTLSALKEFAGKVTVVEAKKEAIANLERSGNMKLDYLEIANAETLQPVENWEDAENLVVCVAIFHGPVRLIDNVLIP